MKKIYLLRHAKAFKEGLNDFERDLNEKGKEDIKKMLKKLEKYGLSFDMIVSSKATRALKTAKKFAQHYNKELHLEDSFYEANANDLFSYIKNLDDSINSVLLVGHNPALSELAELLSDICINSFPTSSVLGLYFESDSFKNLKEHEAKILFFECVKNL